MRSSGSIRSQQTRIDPRVSLPGSREICETLASRQLTPSARVFELNSGARSKSAFTRLTARSNSRSALRSAFLTLALLAPATAWAQAVVNPTTAEFDPSADHDALDNGVAIVSTYELGFYQIGASQPFQIMSLGKSDPAPDGKIRVVFTGLMGTVPTPGIEYEARVSAVGPGGVGTSGPSNPFSFSAPSLPCAYTVAPLVQTVGAGAGSGSVSATTAAVCGWTATSNATWITITNAGPGAGNGTVDYSVTPNPSASQRIGDLTVAGRTVTITQTGTCVFTLSTTNLSVPAGGGNSSVTVTTNAGCGWTASSNASWITITSGSAGSGTALVTFSASANTSPTPRTGTLTVAGRTVIVTQPSANAAPSVPTGVQIR